jgi:ribosomal protein S25
MGGTKKPTISKLKKMVTRGRQDSKKEEKRKEIYKYHITDKEKEDILNYIKKQKYVTPFMVSRKAEIRLSVARELLREFANNGTLKLIEKNRELEIYTAF